MLGNSEIEKLPAQGDIWQETLGWQPSDLQQSQFQQLYEQIVLGNRQFNLTRLTSVMDFWEKHLWDSLAGLKGLGLTSCLEKQESLSLVDIGTGAGFPGIPVAIAFPFWQVRLLDATRKKMMFLDNLLTELHLKNAQTLTARAEEIGRDKYYRETYDLALIRAVSAPSVCAEYALPTLKIGGLAILYRGNWSEEETVNLNTAINQLGSKIESIEQFTTPLTNSMRHCIYLRKIAITPAQFPRAVGTPAHQPLS